MAVVAAVCVVLLAFYAIAGASLQSLSADSSPTPGVAALAALVVGVVGVIASVTARRRSWSNAGVLTLAVGLSGGAGLAWAGVASGSGMAEPIAVALTALAAAAITLGIRGTANGP